MSVRLCEWQECPHGPGIIKSRNAETRYCCLDCSTAARREKRDVERRAAIAAALAARQGTPAAPAKGKRKGKEKSGPHRLEAAESSPPAPAGVETPIALVAEELRDQCYALARELKKAKASKAELVAAVERAANQALAGLRFRPVPPPAKDTRKKTPEVAIAILSDWQLGKRTPTYSSEVCEHRVAEYAQKVITMTAIQRADHPVKELRVYLLGDLVEGEMIFPGQAFRIDASLFQQAIVDGPRILGNFIRTVLPHFERVRVVGVVGNHGSMGGRARKDYHPETNADAMMYEVTRKLFENEPRVEWLANREQLERKWYAIDRVGAKRFFLFHGDQIKGGFAGHPWYGFGKKLSGWYTISQLIENSGIREPFEYACSGHFHTTVRMYLNGLTHWGSGSTESTNTYAAEELAASGEPSQWLLYVHPVHGVTAEYVVHLGREERAA